MKKQRQLMTCQAAANYLSVFKKIVAEMVRHGLLRQVKTGSKMHITAQGIARVLGYDPTSAVLASNRSRKYIQMKKSRQFCTRYGIQHGAVYDVCNLCLLWYTSG